MSSTSAPGLATDDVLPTLATFLYSRRDTVIARSTAAIRASRQITASDPLDRQALADHLPVLLDDLADLLRGSPIDAQVTQDAQTHGSHRWEQAYSVAEVARELSIVCRVVLEEGLDAFSDLHPHASPGELRQARKSILQFFEQTVAESIRQFVEREQKEQENLHARLRATDRALAAATRSERDRLAELFSRSPSFMAVVRGADHVFELANEQFHRFLQRDDILRKPVREVLPAGVDQPLLAMLDQVYTTGQPFVDDEMPVLLDPAPGRSAEEHYVDVVCQPLHGPGGAVDGIFIHGVDRTQRKLVQKTLAQLSEQRRLALDSARMGWWQYDLLSGTMQGDERLRAIFGAGAKDSTREEILSRIVPEDRARVDAAVAAATRRVDPEPYHLEYRVRHDDGSIHWVLARGEATFEGEGEERRAVRFLGTVLDTTESKALLEAQRASEARFHELADAMPQIVWTARPDGTLDYTNRRWFEYVDRSETEFAAADWQARVHPEDAERAAALWHRAIASGEPYGTEFRLRRADGEYRWFLVRALAIRDGDGTVLRWNGTCTDIHEQRMLHERHAQLLDSERAARSEAERTSRLKDEFLATLSHELRTPLNAILGWAHVLRADLSNAEDVEQGLTIIERNARAQTAIIEDLLDMSSIISGRVRLQVDKLDLAEVVAAAVESLQPAADAKGIRLLAVLDPRAQAVVGDPGRLQQVFWNLVSNAVKFTPKGGRVNVMLERVHSHLEVCVSDTGEGIAPEFLPQVFDRFRQADASTTRRHGGLGLGLAIVKQLVELHGGSVYAESAGIKQGSTFRVRLPLSAVRAEEDATATDERRARHEVTDARPLDPTVNLAGLRVLVVDDEVDARKLLQHVLEARAAAVWTAGSAAEALALLENQRPDVLVSDIGMPEEDGYALLGRVRALGSARGGDVPAIAVTAYARPEDRRRAIAAGFQVQLDKPVDAAELLLVVANLAGLGATGVRRG
jgi:PAS domain S-box-containing protein